MHSAAEHTGVNKRNEAGITPLGLLFIGNARQSVFDLMLDEGAHPALETNLTPEFIGTNPNLTQPTTPLQISIALNDSHLFAKMIEKATIDSKPGHSLSRFVFWLNPPIKLEAIRDYITVMLKNGVDFG